MNLWKSRNLKCDWENIYYRATQEIDIVKKEENLAEYLSNFICDTSFEISKSERDLLSTQHRIAKDLFDWTEVNSRLQNCENYQANFSLFFEVSSAWNIQVQSISERRSERERKRMQN